MTGQVIDRETAGFLILLIPLAIAAVVLLAAWPYILALMGVIIAFKLWQNYQWLQWCNAINPFFNQLIKENQGCLTAMDLSLKANLTGGAAKRFLEKKAEEFGAQRKLIQDRGTVYYFLTASALGSIFDDSEPFLEAESISNPPQLTSTLLTSFPKPETPSVTNIAQLVEIEEKSTTPVIIEPPVTTEETISQEISQEQVAEESTAETAPEEDLSTQTAETTSVGLTQAELAKRLEITPTTVSKRKSDPDFSEWSQSKDPEGIAWKYVPATKTFVPVDEQSK